MGTNRQLADQPLLPSEAAALLGITEERLLAEASRGEIPGVCLGDEWRFSATRLTALLGRTDVDENAVLTTV